MNGEVALWYARSRYSTSDIDRARRAQEVGEAIFNRMVSLDAWCVHRNSIIRMSNTFRRISA